MNPIPPVEDNDNNGLCRTGQKLKEDFQSLQRCTHYKAIKPTVDKLLEHLEKISSWKFKPSNEEVEAVVNGESGGICTATGSPPKGVKYTTSEK